ncbi:hypothetical protein K1719_024222 [Acacia pycnantha]|nr:hypothetical protein K1719_024222 [Acacia pycnantha]
MVIKEPMEMVTELGLPDTSPIKLIKLLSARLNHQARSLPLVRLESCFSSISVCDIALTSSALIVSVIEIEIDILEGEGDFGSTGV